MGNIPRPPFVFVPHVLTHMLLLPYRPLAPLPSLGTLVSPPKKETGSIAWGPVYFAVIALTD